jgi:hypothetical protein
MAGRSWLYTFLAANNASKPRGFQAVSGQEDLPRRAPVSALRGQVQQVVVSSARNPDAEESPPFSISTREPVRPTRPGMSGPGIVSLTSSAGTMLAISRPRT